jgi:hypothetical protein
MNGQREIEETDEHGHKHTVIEYYHRYMQGPYLKAVDKLGWA